MTEAEIAAYYDTLEKECGIDSDHPDADRYWARELKLRYDDMPAAYQAQVDKMGSDQIRKIFEMLSESARTSVKMYEDHSQIVDHTETDSTGETIFIMKDAPSRPASKRVSQGCKKARSRRVFTTFHALYAGLYVVL